MEEPEDSETKTIKPERLTFIGSDQTAERRKIQEAIQKAKEGSRIEIGVEKSVTIPPNRKPSVCNVSIPYFKLTLTGRVKLPESQVETPDNQPENGEETESTQNQPDDQENHKDSPIEAKP